MSPPRPTLPVVLIAVLTASCGDGSAPFQADLVSSERQIAASPLTIRTVDQLFEYLGNTLPGGFGGLMYDDQGALVMLLKDVSARDAALDELIAAQVNPVDNPAQLRAAITIREVEFSFPELQGWRKLAARLDLPGAASFDVAEDRNRVEVGVFGQPEPTESMLLAAGIPARALFVFSHPGNQTHGSATHNLSSRIRPLQAGTAVEATNDDGTCTIGGVLVHAQFGNAIITNSHCSDVPASLDNGVFHQPFEILSQNVIGTEVRDPAFSSLILDFNCPSGRRVA